MSPLLVISGPPGSGKSTVAELIADRHDPSAVVAGDTFFGILRRGAIEPWREDASDQNTRITRVQAATAARYRDEGYSTVFDSVLGPWFVPEFRAVAGPFDYAVLLPDVEMCLARVRRRHGHPFTNETATRSLHDQFVAAPLDVRHVFDSGRRTAAELAVAIEVARSAGRLRID